MSYSSLNTPRGASAAFTTSAERAAAAEDFLDEPRKARVELMAGAAATREPVVKMCCGGREEKGKTSTWRRRMSESLCLCA
jgi:hypothetical protein